ncbi:EexN family lipoprotein (plasmid) [Sinorhizobium meliloti]|uniref:EexN family lipoprotein n=1 Tax=Rhizobium meliloti TaxID=382 RepID=UPI002D77C7CF|nr:EexN family lipoprotein [Sinorhizobium meliloti]WRQ69946.1 EexN family lipoprotein [Sinorhizobium meliloti]
MRQHFLSVFLLVLVACSKEAERVYTVGELIADKALLADLIGKCRHNPGELGNTPNCQNAAAADFRARLERM